MVPPSIHLLNTGLVYHDGARIVTPKEAGLLLLCRSDAGRRHEGPHLGRSMRSIYCKTPCATGFDCAKIIDRLIEISNASVGSPSRSDRHNMDLREIARRARVSTATASRAINRVPTVDPQLSRRVWKVVDELGYYPNTQARALVSGRSRLFGLIVSEFTNPFFPEIVQTFENQAVENNYEILLTSTVHDPKRMESSVRRMIERRVDGVAILTFGMEDTLIEHLRFRKVPLVFVDVGPDVPGIANIRVNYQNGIRQAIQHLAALRHTRIAFITGPLHLKSALARRDAFRLAMTEIGLSAELIVEGD